MPNYYWNEENTEKQESVKTLEEALALIEETEDEDLLEIPGNINFQFFIS